MKRALALAIAATLSFSACQSTQRSAAPGKAAASRGGAEYAAQQRAYERGVAQFGEEKYEAARQSWLEAVRLGPKTAVAAKARTNLTKVEAILQTLREIDKQ